MNRVVGKPRSPCILLSEQITAGALQHRPSSISPFVALRWPGAW